MSENPDCHELIRRLNRCEALFDELRKVVGNVLEWKDKVRGGIVVMAWVIGGIQSVVLICLGLAANSLNNTATILGNHAVELATARTKIDTFMSGPRFTAETNAAADARLEDKIREWVRKEINHKHAQ